MSRQKRRYGLGIGLALLGLVIIGKGESIGYEQFALAEETVTVIPTTVPTQTPQADTTQAPKVTSTPSPTVAPTKKPKKQGKIVVKKGKKYYKKANGKYAKNRFVTIKKKTYYFNKKGVMHTGWLKKGKAYYFFNRKTGVQKKKTKVDGIKIQKNGKAKVTKDGEKKIKMMIEAREVMEKVTKASDSKSTKLKKVFKWVMDKPYNRYRILALARKDSSWHITYARDVFDKGNGCCVSEACAFAFLAKECGYSKVSICDDTSHAWVEVDGYVYDTLFAVSKSYDKYYHSTYKNAKLHCVNKKKL